MAVDSSAGPKPAPSKAPASAGGASSFINQKIGPFPLWVYILAVGVGFYAYEKRKGTAPSASTKKGTTTGSQNGGVNGAGEGAAYGSAVSQTLAANAPGATTNPQWEANAETVLTGYGYPTVQVQSALNTYLAGGVLSSVQQEIVNAVIEAVGQPPSPPTSTANASTASPTVAAAPAASPVQPSNVAPAPSVTDFVMSGSGYNSGNPNDPTMNAAGQGFIPVSSDSQLSGYTGATYYEIEPGQFQQVAQTDFGKLAPGTTIYIPKA